jgi:hypothetical protein
MVPVPEWLLPDNRAVDISEFGSFRSHHRFFDTNAQLSDTIGRLG